MYCPTCGCPCQPSDQFCHSCGASFAAVPVSFPEPESQRSRLPYMILWIMALVGTLLFFLIPIDSAEATPSAPEVTESSLLTEDCFILDDGVLYFDSSKYSGHPVLLVPSAINNQPVTAIGDGCFENAAGITTIVLPSSVTAIEDRAFANCSDLRGLFVPEAVTSIGTEAFLGCKNLESVCLSTAIRSIGSDAFEDCPNLLYLFYSGFYEDWIELYPQPITPFTWVISWDGENLHAAQPS